ncbi:MAG: tetratricopeptide repeat protein [Terracidiphilus sp.]
MYEIDRQIERGLSHHRAGNVQAAAEIYREILEQHPNHPDALYLMGCLAHEQGDSAAAVSLLNKAILARPEQAEYYNALGSAHTHLENLSLAECNLRKAISLGSQPHFHLSLGVFLKEQHRLNEAIVEFETAVKLAPDDAEARLSLGKAYRSAGRLQDATQCLETSLALHPGHPPTLAALRQTLCSANREENAVAHLSHAIASLGDDVDGLCGLADALQQAEDFDGAIEVYHRALAYGSQSPRAWYACGCAETAREDFASAIVCFQRALSLHPDSLEARHNLARALYEMGQVPQAYDEFKVCAARQHDDARLARAMLAIIAPGAWQATNQEVLEIRQSWVKDLPTDNLPLSMPPLIPSTGGKLKIGYASSFFSSDNWMKPVWGLINRHNRLEFEVYLFSDAPRSAIVHGYIAHEADHFFDTTRLSNRELAQLIRDQGIHVLVDLNGYSNINRLPMFMHRPAPVIVGWFNMYATTGMSCFDFLIGDASVIPPEEETFYSEKIGKVTHSYLTFSVDYPVPPVAELPCIRNSVFTFGCLGSQYKITGEVVQAWRRILTKAPGSRLLLKNKRLKTSAAREFMASQFSMFGLNPERVFFEGPEDHFGFLKAYDRIDAALDTFPYNGGTTTTEALWQGVPVIAFAGDRWASRTSASILREGGLAEFVAGDLDGYVSLAANLANSPEDWPRLAHLRAGMRAHLMASSVCDTGTFALEMEQIYRMCRRMCSDSRLRS